MQLRELGVQERSDERHLEKTRLRRGDKNIHATGVYSLLHLCHSEQ